MKILQINSAKAFGGGERHLIDLCKGLQNSGHDVFVALRPNNQWEDKLDFLPQQNQHHFPLRNSLDALSASQIAEFIKNNNIEIIHAHVARDYPIAALASRLSKTPLVLTRHLTYKLNGLHRLTFKQAKKVIAVSNGVAESLSGLVEQRKITVVHNGVDTVALGEIEKVKNSVVATIGELREHKGQADFIKSAAIIAKKYPPAKFLVIGKDNSTNQEYRTFLENLTAELNLKDKITFTGWLDNPSEIYGAFDIFVSSARSEPFGLVIAEAMASRKAIVATKTVGAKEILTDNESGKLVEIGNIEQLAGAVLQFLEDKPLRQTLGANAQKKAEKFFSLERMVEQTEKIYREII